MGFFGLILKWDVVSLEQSFQIHSYVSVLGWNSSQFTFHLFSRWGCLLLTCLASALNPLSWVMATQGLACMELVAMLWDRAERRWALLLLSLGTFSLGVLECLEETATASIFQHL